MISTISKEINSDYPKLIEDCFINIKIMISVWPEEAINIVIDLAQSEFFYNKTLTYFDHDTIRTIYFNWISSIKVIVKDSKAFAL
jgi:hypothetical protein